MPTLRPINIARRASFQCQSLSQAAETEWCHMAAGVGWKRSDCKSGATAKEGWQSPRGENGLTGAHREQSQGHRQHSSGTHCAHKTLSFCSWPWGLNKSKLRPAKSKQWREPLLTASSAASPAGPAQPAGEIGCNWPFLTSLPAEKPQKDLAHLPQWLRSWFWPGSPADNSLPYHGNEIFLVLLFSPSRQVEGQGRLASLWNFFFFNLSVIQLIAVKMSIRSRVAAKWSEGHWRKKSSSRGKKQEIWAVSCMESWEKKRTFLHLISFTKKLSGLYFVSPFRSSFNCS